MSTTVMSLKTDKAIKEKAQTIAKGMGFSLGTLINAFLRQLIKEKAVHFTLEKKPYIINPKFIKPK